MAEINWDKLRNEYLASHISLSSLAKKSNISKSTLYKRAIKEGWQEKRKQLSEESDQKALAEIVSKKASISDTCFDVMEKLVIKMAEAVEVVESTNIGGQKVIMGMLKDLYDMGAFKVSEEDAKATIHISFDSEVDDYAD